MRGGRASSARCCRKVTNDKEGKVSVDFWQLRNCFSEQFCWRGRSAFPRAAVTVYHKRGWLKTTNLLSDGSAGKNSEISVLVGLCSLSVGSRQGSFLAFSQLLAVTIFAIPSHHSNFCLCSYMMFSLRLNLCPHFPLFIPVIGLGSTLVRYNLILT